MADKRAFNVIIDEDLHLFLKILATKKSTSMNIIIEDCLRKLKEKSDKKVLQSRNTSV
jgi:predicted HicB family RNase H-like nuclease